MRPETENSPFIPETNVQYAWDATSLTLLKECPRKYYLKMIEGWRSKGSSMHLVFGSEVATALEHYHLNIASGQTHDEAEISVVHDCLVSTKDWETGDSKKNRDTLIRTIVWYLETYKNDPAEVVMLKNGKPAVEMSFRFEIDHYPTSASEPYVLCGHMDKLVNFDGTLFVMDQKTTGSTIGSYYFDRYNPDNQMSLYTLASQIVFQMPFAGVIIDGIQIAVGFTAFARGITTRSKAQLDEWLNDTKFWIDMAERYALRDHWPMNETSCSNFGNCEFRGICNKDPAVREMFLKTEFEKVLWNPLEVR
jgi:hypothetical protein